MPSIIVAHRSVEREMRDGPRNQPGQLWYLFSSDGIHGAPDQWMPNLGMSFDSAAAVFESNKVQKASLPRPR
jgi:hypothetical protein